MWFLLTATNVVSGDEGFSLSGCGQSTCSDENGHSCTERRSQLGPFHHMTWLASLKGYKPLKAQSAGFDDPGMCASDLMAICPISLSLDSLRTARID